jgi:large subunit ribosomal protein L33
MGKAVREIINFECTVCKHRNYTGTKNKKQHQEKLELKRYCKFCHKHTPHKEIK